MDWAAWIYEVEWGIVIGTLGLLAVFLVCLDIAYRESEQAEGQTTETPAEHREKAAADTKHAA